jgi:hypothetical protein
MAHNQYDHLAPTRFAPQRKRRIHALVYTLLGSASLPSNRVRRQGLALPCAVHGVGTGAGHGAVPNNIRKGILLFSFFHVHLILPFAAFRFVASFTVPAPFRHTLWCRTEFEVSARFWLSRTVP